MNILKILSVTFLIGVILGACDQPAATDRDTGYKHGVVVSAHPEASAAGLEILKAGGNAVDAAVATGFALAVCYPPAGNIGGGGFMVIRFADGRAATLDYREKAPLKAYEKMFQDEQGNVRPGESTDSYLASGVPGAVDGMLTAHRKYGKLSLKEVIRPAILLAEKGFPVTEKQASSLNHYREAFLQANKVPPVFVKETPWKAGDTLVQKELATTLRHIRDEGRKGFYSGPVAEALVKQMEEEGGWITREDLEAYHSVWREPLTGRYKEYKIISMPPPSSGGVALLQLLRMTGDYPLKDWGWNTPATVNVMVEAEKRVYADRAKYLGDPDFFLVPVEGLVSEEYCRNRMKGFVPGEVTPADSIYAGDPAGYESEETTHYSIIDDAGNAVSVTTTLNRSYGNKVVVRGAGFLLNNEMDDFSIKPGYPNSFGLIGGQANAIQPGKRMLSSMTPTIVEKNGKLYMVVGSPGGSTIITSVFQTILNVTAHGMPMQKAVDAGRFHHQWKPDLVFYEKNAFTPQDTLKLKEMGYHLKLRRSIGRVDAALVTEDGKIEAGADPRGDDAAAGF
jgi:gamma-glutamyltranspeptidase/glutathione hydrolase